MNSAPQMGAWRRFMGEFSPIHWLIVLAIILLLFGGRKIPELARGLGEGIRSFKEGMSGNHPPTTPSNQTPPPADKPAEEKKA
jgi:sec-independent protein translocase protein TatA